MEPENHLFEKENHLNQTSIFGFKMLIFRGVPGKRFRSTPWLVSLDSEDDWYKDGFGIDKSWTYVPPEQFWSGPLFIRAPQTASTRWEILGAKATSLHGHLDEGMITST